MTCEEAVIEEGAEEFDVFNEFYEQNKRIFNFFYAYGNIISKGNISLNGCHSHLDKNCTEPCT